MSLIRAIQADAAVTSAVRRPTHAFLGRWLADFDRQGSEALAIELLMLCHEYRLGVFVPGERAATAGLSGDARRG